MLDTIQPTNLLKTKSYLLSDRQQICVQKNKLAFRMILFSTSVTGLFTELKLKLSDLKHHILVSAFIL